MQVDFCGEGGWVDQLGQDLGTLREAIPGVARALRLARDAGVQVIHTREGHRSDLSDLPANKRWRTGRHGLGVGQRGAHGRILVQGEPGHALIAECAALPGETIVDKPGKGAFHSTELEGLLRDAGIGAVSLCGVTSDCCVQATFRDAGERGFDPLLLSDATAAVTPAHHTATLAILAAHGGRWGAVGCVDDFAAALAASP